MPSHLGQHHNAELAERISSKQHIFALFVAEQDFGPVHHRSTDKLQGVRTERKRFAFLHGQLLDRFGERHKLRQQSKRLCRRHKRRFRVLRDKISNSTGMVRFQMVNHQVIRLTASESSVQIGKPLAHLVGIHRVRHGNLFVQNHIRIIRHTLGYHVLAFEQIQIAVIDTDILDVFAKVFHKFSFLFTK